jgi:hypothetical protein
MRLIIIALVSFLSFTNLVPANASVETLIYPKNSETVLYIKNKALASFYDRTGERSFFTIDGNKRSVNKKISLLNRVSLVTTADMGKVWVKLDNFYPELAGDGREILETLGLKPKLLYKKGSFTYFGDSVKNNKLLITTKKTDNGFLISEILIKDKSKVKSTLSLFSLPESNTTEVKFKFSKISTQSLEMIDKLSSIKYTPIGEIINRDGYVGTSIESIKSIISKVLLGANSKAEAQGLSIISVSDIEKELLGFNPERYLDLSIRAKASSLEVGNIVSGEYYCGRLLRYDYFVERVDIESSKC